MLTNLTDVLPTQGGHIILLPCPRVCLSTDQINRKMALGATTSPRPSPAPWQQRTLTQLIFLMAQQLGFNYTSVLQLEKKFRQIHEFYSEEAGPLYPLMLDSPVLKKSRIKNSQASFVVYYSP